MAVKRHLRDVLDADTINSSNSLKIVSHWVQGAKTYLESSGYTAPFNPSVHNGGSEGAWIAVWNMGDDQDGIPPNPLGSSFETPSIFNHYLGFFPIMHGVDLDHQQQSYGDFAQIHANSGLQHLANVVQFGKGASTINGSIGGDFLSGGSNLPSVSAQQGTYKTGATSIALSDFRGVQKNQLSSTFVYGDTQDETLAPNAAISVGNAATNPNNA